ncbi:MAG: GerAB/ArcD/ProY family transporter, partial [Pseudoflavonifractor sp.]
MGGIGGEGRGCGEDKISLHQIMVLSAVALLAPATTALPGQTARMAGGLSWTAPLLALPAVLALVWSLRRLCRRRGLAQAFEEILGRRWGRILTAAYLLWGLLLLAAHGGTGVERLAAGGYGGGTWLPLAALLVLVLWVARGKTCTLARGAEIFKLILAATLGAVLVLSLSRMELRNLLPVTGTGGFGIPSAAAAILSRLGAGVYSGFLAGA